MTTRKRRRAPSLSLNEPEGSNRLPNFSENLPVEVICRILEWAGDCTTLRHVRLVSRRWLEAVVWLNEVELTPFVRGGCWEPARGKLSPADRSSLCNLPRMSLGFRQSIVEFNLIYHEQYRPILFCDNSFVTDFALNRLSFCSLRKCLLTAADRITGAGIKDLSNCDTLEELHIENVEKLADGSFEKCLQRFPRLRVLTLLWCPKVKDGIAAALCKLPYLQELNLSHAEITDESGKFFGQIPSLTKLNVRGCSKLSNAFIRHLLSPKSATRRQLQVLDISGNENFTDLIGKYLSEASVLKEVAFKNCDKLTSIPFVEHLSRVQSLVCLSLSNLRAASGAAYLFELGKLKALQSMDLSGCDGIDSVETVSCFFLGLPRLGKLNVNQCDWMTDSILCALATVNNLQTLSCASCRNVSPEGFKVLAVMSTLASLDLSKNSSVSDSVIQFVSQLPVLTSLNVSFCNLTLSAVNQIATAASQLTDLSIASNGVVTDDWLPTLARLPLLKRLVLPCRGLDAAGRQEIAKFPALEELYYWDQWGLIMSSDLSRALPRLRVRFAPL